MKSTGIVRKVDDLGRIVIPVELRRTMRIGDGESVEVFTDEKTIVLTKYAPHCVFCEESRDVMVFKGQMVCSSCAEQLHQMRMEFKDQQSAR